MKEEARMPTKEERTRTETPLRAPFPRITGGYLSRGVCLGWGSGGRGGRGG